MPSVLAGAILCGYISPILSHLFAWSYQFYLPPSRSWQCSRLENCSASCHQQCSGPRHRGRQQHRPAPRPREALQEPIPFEGNFFIFSGSSATGAPGRHEAPVATEGLAAEPLRRRLQSPPPPPGFGSHLSHWQHHRPCWESWKSSFRRLRVGQMGRPQERHRGAPVGRSGDASFLIVARTLRVLRAATQRAAALRGRAAASRPTLSISYMFICCY